MSLKCHFFDHFLCAEYFVIWISDAGIWVSETIIWVSNTPFSGDLKYTNYFGIWGSDTSIWISDAVQNYVIWVSDTSIWVSNTTFFGHFIFWCPKYIVIWVSDTSIWTSDAVKLLVSEFHINPQICQMNLRYHHLNLKLHQNIGHLNVRYCVWEKNIVIWVSDTCIRVSDDPNHIQ